jgi:hypothetical protein
MERRPSRKFVFESLNLIWGAGGVLAALGIKLFVGGMYVQQNYPTVDDLKAAVSSIRTELANERAYEREQHENMTKELHGFSNDNHTDAVMKVAALTADQRIMSVKIDQLIDTVREIRELQQSKKR